MTGPDAHDAAVESIEEARDRFRAEARALLGVGAPAGGGPTVEPAGAAVGWYPLVALGVLAIVDQLQGFGFFVLGPEMSRALGISSSTLAGLAALKTFAITLATLPMAAYVQRRARRASVALVTAFVWAAMTLATGFVVGILGLIVVLVVDGVSSGSVAAVHPSLLVDSYPAGRRVRILAGYRAFEQVGSGVAPLLVALMVGPLALTWRGVFLGAGVLCTAAAMLALRLRDPGFGSFDTARVREAVARAEGAPLDDADGDAVDLGFFEIVRRLLLIPTVRRLMAGYAVLGMMLVPLLTFLFFFLEERWAMGPSARAMFLAAMAGCSMVSLAFFAPRGERVFREDPGRLVRLGASALAVGSLLLAAAMLSPRFGVMVVLCGLAWAVLALVNPALQVSLLSIVPPRMRPHAAALAAINLSAVGGFGGLLLLGGIDRRFGTAGAIASLALPGVAAALVLRTASKTVAADFDRLVDDTVEETELRLMARRGTALPMLAVRNLDFSYGPLQVLFGVDFTVDDGEMVALLGTNGAGKSTLLKVVSGLALPERGSVRLRGADVTYLDAERRVRLGIVQVPGGRAAYGSLSVAENLRLHACAFGRDRRSVEAGIDAAFDAFPRLAERRDQTASTLSGGEQQMLALSKALILRPQLLLIDELSLGLAPVVVGQLLETVRRINREGTAVVLVEQSVNIALSVADHAYFMEKGEIRFDGRAADLRDRTDLLRAVFLDGAASVI